MRVVIQRVSDANVAVDGKIVGKIGHGLLVFAGFEEADSESDLQWMAGKLVRMRIFSDADDVMNLSIAESGGAILAVSQFTLYASVKKATGHRGVALPGALSRSRCSRDLSHCLRRSWAGRWPLVSLALIWRSAWSMMGLSPS